MILYGRNLSPFTRRVAIWLTLQGRAFERRELSVVDHFDQIAAVSPVARVPVLALDDGTRLIEAWAICDWLDMTAPQAALIPASGPARTAALQAVALGSAVADKVVALVYEKNRRDPALHYPAVIEKIERQIAGGLAALEALAPDHGWIGGDAPNGADVALVCAHDIAAATNAYLLKPGYPRLAGLAARANALPAFAATKP
ncbi:MAG: glutathione S-transferase family protein [Rhodobacterales bacterium CG_4_10_14_0_8_um_filter_70_9]|nr:MAG: glutathione S-transferase family protein [Rhodobacterales bacterium CG_4_10_14_0_8_um_filter_70_9]